MAEDAGSGGELMAGWVLAAWGLLTAGGVLGADVRVCGVCAVVNGGWGSDDERGCSWRWREMAAKSKEKRDLLLYAW